MSLGSEIMLRLGFYKNRVRVNYLLSTGRWVSWFCPLIDENTIKLPKIRKSEKDSKMPKLLRITSKPCFDETNKIYEFHGVEGQTGTINWFGATGSTEDKEDRRLISRAIDAGEKLKAAEMEGKLFNIPTNLFLIGIIALQLICLAGIYTILNP